MAENVKADITESKEALIALNELSIFLANRFKDGVQLGDFTAFWDTMKNDKDFGKKLQNAFDGWSKISGEMSDVDLAEGLELANIQISYIPKLIEALKKS